MPPPRLSPIPLAQTLSSLKNAHLASLCGILGLTKSGKKDVLTRNIQSAIDKPRIKWQSNHVRILSVDMGIRNLAYCVVEVSIKPTRKFHMSMELQSWKRVDLSQFEPNLSKSVSGASSRLSSMEEETLGKKSEDFQPPVLAPKAYQLIKNELLPYEPSIILIERQRFRQASGAAVQEWTLRVNMLESMLWAILETMKQESKATHLLQGIDVFDVAPKAVAQFWVEKSVLESGRRKVKIEKKDKIALVQDWFTEKKDGTFSISPRNVPDHFTISEDLPISFTQQSERIRQAFGQTTTPRKRTLKGKKTTKAAKGTSEAVKEKMDDDEPEVDVKKRDDLADCFLQAAAWAAWEQNRLKLEKLIQDGVNDSNEFKQFLGG